MTTIFTDGACRNNGKNNSRASFAVYVGNKIIRGIVKPYIYSISDNNDLHIIENQQINPSNNRGELLAIIYGLLYILNNTDKEYILYSDSLICINTINIWYFNREKKGTINEFKNLDLIQIIMDLIKKIKQSDKKINCLYVRGHQKNKDIIYIGNNIADKYASEILNNNIDIECEEFLI